MSPIILNRTISFTNTYVISFCEIEFISNRNFARQFLRSYSVSFALPPGIVENNPALLGSSKNGSTFENEIVDDTNYLYDKYIARVYQVSHLTSYCTL